jgi:hypothetical protein
MRGGDPVHVPDSARRQWVTAAGLDYERGTASSQPITAAGGYGEPVDMRGVLIAVKISGRWGSMGQRRTARSKCSIYVVLIKEGSYPPTSMAKAP